MKLCVGALLHVLLPTYQDGPRKRFRRAEKNPPKPNTLNKPTPRLSQQGFQSAPLRGHDAGQTSQQCLNIHWYAVASKEKLKGQTGFPCFFKRFGS